MSKNSVHTDSASRLLLVSPGTHSNTDNSDQNDHSQHSAEYHVHQLALRHVVTSHRGHGTSCVAGRGSLGGRPHVKTKLRQIKFAVAATRQFSAVYTRLIVIFWTRRTRTPIVNVACRAPCKSIYLLTHLSSASILTRVDPVCLR